MKRNRKRANALVKRKNAASPDSGRQAVLLYLGGVVFTVCGLYAIVWRVRHLDEPPILHAGHPYATSKQLGSISAGVVLLLFGWLAYREGLKWKR
jgi:hypothetical protein